MQATTGLEWLNAFVAEYVGGTKRNAWLQIYQAATEHFSDPTVMVLPRRHLTDRPDEARWMTAFCRRFGIKLRDRQAAYDVLVEHFLPVHRKAVRNAAEQRRALKRLEPLLS